jgi:ADP-ribosyltransferase exoenzyme
LNDFGAQRLNPLNGQRSHFEPGFLSTTLDLEPAEMFGGGLVLELVVDEPTPMIYLQTVPESTRYFEEEVLLPRGCRLIALGPLEDNRLRCRVEPPWRSFEIARR